MRKSLVALLLAIGATAFVANLALAGPDEGDITSGKLMNANMAKELQSRANRLGSSATTVDTTFVGYTPGKYNAANNYWSIWSGSDKFSVPTGPYHRPPAQGAMWDWDGPYGSHGNVNPVLVNVHGDSLQGWWSVRNQMSGTGGLTIPDYDRPWRALDFGNEVNYSRGPSSGGRTFGVVGLWHVDGGNLTVAPASTTWSNEAAGSGGINWAPLTGNSSAWMGMRRHGDNTHVDDVSRGGTGNPFNENMYSFQWFNSVSTGGTDKAFPGYGTSMDQMLYRDIDLSAAGDTTLTVSFQYRTHMSTRFGTNNLTRSGWFVHDPLSVSTGGSDPNFISNNSTVANPPADSFMVYVGAPAEGSVELSDLNIHPIYDAKRRWFGEVIRSNENLYKQIHSSADTTIGTITVAPTVSSADLAILKAAGANKVRLVFRVKTNHLYDDALKTSLAYSSRGIGAAIIDQVQVGKGVAALTLLGGFENASEIDNRESVTAETAWKTTGKPPQGFHHPHFLSNGGPSADLVYQDLCGQVGSLSRICDMKGVVVSAGDHDNDESSGGTFLTAEQEPFQGMFSPVIQLEADANPNSIGLTASTADATDDYYIDYELYTGIFDFFNTGNAWRLGFQSYPAGNTLLGTGEHLRWGDVRFLPFIYFNPDKQCFRALEPIKANGMLRTTGAGSVPDSIRIFIGTRQEAYRFGITQSEWLDGAYWDNLSLDIIDGAGADPLSMQIWNLFHDTFPANDGIPILSIGTPAVFDTTVAHIRAGINTAPATGNTDRFDVPGDTTAVDAEGDNVRMDMIFRILPGPGNYVTVGLPSSGLRAVANAAVLRPAPSTASANFWSNYMGAQGTHGTSVGTPGLATHLAGTWNPNVWLSARMDTAQANVFQLHARGIITPGGGGVWMTAYHESELLPGGVRSALGIARNICFVASEIITSSTQDVICNGVDPIPAGTAYPPVYTSAPGSGYSSGPGNTTVEGTKIIPDGLLTPGSHVEYFFRREDIGSPPPNVYLAPDTNIVTPQPSEGSSDGHRWQQFGVLPDTWKRNGYTHPVLGLNQGGSGRGLACMLYIDQNDRRGNERVWVQIAERIGATADLKYGAHNGWTFGNLDPDVGVFNDPDTYVRRHVGQPGTTWDMYGVKAAESLNTGAGSIGSRGGSSAFSETDLLNTQIDPKTSRLGPTQAMLNSYYKILMVLSGDLNSSIFGPFTNKSQNDYAIMRNFLLDVPATRGFFAEGDGFVEALTEDVANGAPFLANFLGVTLVNPNYKVYEPSPDAAVADVTTSLAGPWAGSIYGVNNACTYTLDVLARNVAIATTENATNYENILPAGSPTPASVSGVLQNPGAPNGWKSLVDGWDIENLTSRDGLSSRGRNQYYYRVFNNIFNSICDIDGAAGNTTDTPDNNDGRLFNFMSLANNPLKSGSATVNFGIAKAERVKIQIFDVSGRLVRTLADRSFTAGEHKLTWDGVNNSGGLSARGVYFVRSQHADSKFTGQSKLIVLK